MKILIREIVPNDYSQTIKVIKRSNTESLGKIYPQKLIDEFCKKYDLENFKKKVQEVKYFIAEDADKKNILGIIGLKHNELRTFFVDTNHQGKGVGRKLFDRFIEEVKKKGLKEIILEGSPLGEPIYKHFGFKKIKTIKKNRVGVDYSDAYMKKGLI
ncbi:MAG: hypothetical protein UR89_C0043G0008 [Candidatus Roizmanbacteria bacterium GW2011_GWA2_35_8]|uniref:N-acetyltransferase domain-containing protein n=1 Tax=Candidatus Roizmanbacteria bacterium GW2011_GWA2_35_8 TaxID=1618479 RepID=A0A0G0CXE6_9BACT|nr:MAG: hypothetical protein UR89_C0043G0008 [Candidatus Roizmanbacteria bacterium GW2011_GWA2_35_8]